MLESELKEQLSYSLQKKHIYTWLPIPEFSIYIYIYKLIFLDFSFAFLGNLYELTSNTFSRRIYERKFWIKYIQIIALFCHEAYKYGVVIQEVIMIIPRQSISVIHSVI